VSHCEVCHQREAVVHLTQAEAGEVRTLHLCSRCAAERGVATESAVVESPLGAFLAAMGGSGAMLAAAAAPADHCPDCDATLADFQASGRLGCPTCWERFDRPLRELLRRIHGSTRHVGNAPAGVSDGAPAPSRTQQLERLRAALAAAVAAERFEEAAELRDRLRALEESPA
jgi:protein arginine kinase activator